MSTAKEDSQGELELLRHTVLVALYDSVRHPRPERRKTRKQIIDIHRAAARRWISAAEMFNDSNGFGFGYAWSQLAWGGSSIGDVDRFVEVMKMVWSAVDKNPSLGKRLAAMFRGMKAKVQSRFGEDNHKEFDSRDASRRAKSEAKWRKLFSEIMAEA